MSLLSVVEVCVHLETFRNIDLYQQGLYRIKLQCSSEDLVGSAYDISLRLSPKNSDPHYLDPARLTSRTAESRAFLVRYCNEEVQMKESIYFQLKIPRPSSIKLRFELLFNDLNGKVRPEEALTLPIKDLTLRAIAWFEEELEFPGQFKAKFLPVLFPTHVSLVTCSVHYAMIDYSLHSNGFSSISVFRDKTGSAREYVGSSETDKIYNLYLEPLIINYKSLSDYYLQVIGRCINQEVRVSLEPKSFPSVLRLPGDLDASRTAFSQRVASHNPDKVSAELMNELHCVGEQNLALWKKMIEFVNKNHRTVAGLLKEQFGIEMRNLISRGVIRKVMRVNDLALAGQNNGEVNHSLAVIRRKENSRGKQICENEAVMIDEVFLRDFGERVQQGVKPRKKFSELHLIVLVHGYQGSAKDMKIFKNEISAIFPYTIFLISTANETRTESSIDILGQNLADEVRAFIQDDAMNQIGSISFIGHSLGGLIIRSAIPHLLDYSSKFHSLLTLSTPHLGIQEGSRLVRAGIWIMNYVKKSDSLCELKLSDSKDIESTTLFNLSLSTGPELFNHFALVSSPQDSYSPHFSSRIEVSKKLTKNYKVYAKMSRNIMKNRQKVVRIDADFKIGTSNIDSWIGRAGHIEFLENRHFMRYLLYLHPEFFE